MADRNVVVLAGSGRSGTTWLGAVLDTFEDSEYFYEIDAFPELDFDSSNLMQVKYPLTHRLPVRPFWTVNLEQRLLQLGRRRGICKETAGRALRIRNRIRPKKTRRGTFVFKIVRLYSLALRCEELERKFGDTLRIIHIIRNPYAQIASQLRMDKQAPERSKQHFQARISSILEDPRLRTYHELAQALQNASWVEQMALVWWVSNERMIQNCPLPRHTVVFEELVRAPYQQVEDIFQFLDWPFSKNTRQFIASTTEAQESKRGQFAITKRAEDVLSKWKSHLVAEDCKRIRNVLGSCELLHLWDAEELSC